MRPILSAILLALLAAAPAGAAFTFSAADPGQVTATGQTHAFITHLLNTGAAADTFVVSLETSVPGGWVTSLCEGSICYAPFIREITVPLAAGAETEIDLDVTPSTIGGGSARLTAASRSAPQAAVALDFTAVTPGLDALLVTATGEGAAAALLDDLPAGTTAALWPRGQAGSLASAELDGFANIVWVQDGAQPGLDDGDRAALAYWIQHGGSLLLAGSDLAWQACDPASPFASASAQSWLQIVAGAAYVDDGAAYAAVSGAAGDPLTGGLSLDLQAVAGRNDACDVLAATSGTVCLSYAGGAAAGVRSVYGDGRTLFCGFDPDGADSAGRAALLQAFLAWTEGPTHVPSGGAARLPLRAAPNPFNPATVLRFVVPSAGAGAVEILDLAGRRVRTVHSGRLAAGEHEMTWRGDDDAGRPVASGTYLVRVAAGGNSAVTKIQLAK